MTESLREKDIEKATEHKRLLEERQRSEERHRAETETPWRTRYFDKEVGRENVFSFRVLEPGTHLFRQDLSEGGAFILH